MSKAVILTVSAEELYNIIVNGSSIILRTSVPKDFVGWVYLCVDTDEDNSIIGFRDDNKNVVFKYLHLMKNWDWSDKDGIYQAFLLLDSNEEDEYTLPLTGRVVARFWFKQYKTLKYHSEVDYFGEADGWPLFDEDKICEAAKIDSAVLLDFQDKCDKNNPLYAWYLGKATSKYRKLEIFEEPKLLENSPEDWRLTEIEDFLQ